VRLQTAPTNSQNQIGIKFIDYYPNWLVETHSRCCDLDPGMGYCQGVLSLYTRPELIVPLDQGSIKLARIKRCFNVQSFVLSEFTIWRIRLRQIAYFLLRLSALFWLITHNLLHLFLPLLVLLPENYVDFVRKMAI